jgi:phenylalanyl-tRNA synthetase beta chain
MLVSLKWLKNYVPDLNQSPEEIEEALTLIGFEVESIEHKGLPAFNNVVVGEVVSKEQHPNADRLSVCKVNTGDPDNLNGIVCGAQNFKVGDRVPVALLGAELPGGFVIQKATLRGVESAGMMCSARELGLGDDHAGLYILEQRPEIGTPINEVFPEGDTVLDVEITPNRPDCLSHVGLARELSAHFGLELILPEIKLGKSDFSKDAGDSLVDRIDIQETDFCHYYTAHSIKGITIAESPKWLKTAIESIGLRPINNVVDVTNYVLHELGQPLHAFDAKKIIGKRLIIRKATEGETIVTLDDKKRILTSTHAVIADEAKGLVVAGIMGSIDAEVDNSTTDIVLEAAWFEPKRTRKASRELGLSTDSSYRFERGVDFTRADIAAYRALDLILETAGGTLCKQVMREGSNALERPTIEFTPEYIRERCGFGPEDARIRTALESLGIDISVVSDKPVIWKAKVPSFRGDLERPIDLVEEFLRIYGTDKIPETNVETTALLREHSREWIIRKETAQYLRSQGFSEAYNYTLLDATKLERTEGEFNKLRLLNPISSDQTHLRPSLIPGIIEVIKTNQNHGNAIARFFEWGRVYLENGDQLTECLGIAFAVHENPAEKHWLNRGKMDFYQLKAIILDLLQISGLKLSDNLITLENIPGYGQQGHFVKGGGLRKGGFEAEFGMLDLKFLKTNNIDGLVYAGCIAILPSVVEKPEKPVVFEAFGHFPPSYKDLALVADADEPAVKVMAALMKAAKSVSDKTFTVEDIQLFDVYQGGGLEAGKKSLAFSMTFRDKAETLKDEKVNQAFEAIQSNIETRSPYRIRR